MTVALVERIKKIDLTEDMGGGLINDPAAAARNRQNIEIMRLREKAHHAEGGLRTEPLLPKQKVITQQVKEIKQEEVSGRFGPSKLKKMHYQRVPRSGYRKIAKDY
jgi:hypothetical protein